MGFDRILSVPEHCLSYHVKNMCRKLNMIGSIAGNTSTFFLYLKGNAEFKCCYIKELEKRTINPFS